MWGLVILGVSVLAGLFWRGIAVPLDRVLRRWEEEQHPDWAVSDADLQQAPAAESLDSARPVSRADSARSQASSPQSPQASAPRARHHVFSGR